MDIIPVIDILDNQVVKAIKGDRGNYESISYKLYNSTDPRDIIDQIIRKYSPKILYIADLDAIMHNKINSELYDNILSLFPKIDFWIDSGLKEIKLKKKYKNYYPVFCSEKSRGYEFTSNKFNNCVCSFDFMEKYIGSKAIYRQQRANPSKIILMDLSQVGSKNNINYKLARRFIRKNNHEYYIAGGIKSIFDIKRARYFGASGVLVSTMIHQNRITKNMIQKEKTSPNNRAG